MRITVSMPFQKMVIPPRCRKPRPEQHFEDVTVDIIELTGSEDVLEKTCPIAFIVYNNISPDTPGEANLKIYRGFNGQLWLPRENRGDRNIEALLIDYLKRVLPERSTRDENYNLLLKQASEFILVNGVIYVPASEPIYKVVTMGLGRNHGGTSIMISSVFYDSEKKESNIFRADELTEAKEYAKRVAMGRGDTNSIESIENIEAYEYIEVRHIEYSKLLSREDRCAIKLEDEIVSFLEGIGIELESRSDPVVTTLMKAIWKNSDFQNNNQTCRYDTIKKVFGQLVKQKLTA